jgi:hypothetical protein
LAVFLLTGKWYCLRILKADFWVSLKTRTSLMVYVISGIFIAFCTVVIFFAIRVFRENRKMAPKKRDGFNDDEIKFRP